MLKHLTLLLMLSFCVPKTANAQNKKRDSNADYKLVWADEFNNEGTPDTTNWTYEQGFVRNNEAQWYQKQNAVCHKGMLTIFAKRVHMPNPYYVVGSENWKTSRQFIDYTSASINTRGLHAWQYGRFIMRARIPVKPGMWPAFWALGINKPWPANGEIDMMEFYKNKLLANIATGSAKANKAVWHSKTKSIDSLGKNWSENFHIWRMDWDSEKISLYMDDILLNDVPMKELVNQDGSNFNPFMQPEYLLLNLAIGGDNGGVPSATAFPGLYQIDYVRVYQKSTINH